MNAYVETLISLGLVGLDTWMIAFASRSFFQRGCSNVSYYLSVLVLFVVNNAVSRFFSSDLARLVFLKFLINAVLIIIWSKFVYHINVIRGFFYSVFILAYLTIIDDICVLMISSIAGDSVQFAFSNPYTYLSICFFTKTVELFGIIVVQNVVEKRVHTRSLTWFDWTKVLIFPGSSLLVSLLLSRIVLGESRYEKEIAISLFILLLVDIFSIYFLSHLEKTQVAIRENAILRQNMKLESEHIISLQENYAQQRKQTHDFYNQLAVLQGMADKKLPPEEFSQYLGKLLSTKVPSVFYIDTHRAVINVVLSQKVTLARQKNIDFQLQLENLSDFPLPDDVLVVVLTNLIDNAIESCDKILNNDKRYIKLAIKATSPNAWICIENTTSEYVNIKNNQVQTTKGDPLLHGYGLKNVAALIAEFGGTYSLDFREREMLFCFYSTIPRNH